MATDTFPVLYKIDVTDGVSFRTIQPAALGEHRTAIEAALRAILWPAPAKPAAAPLSRSASATMTQGEIAQAEGYLGDSCGNCGGWRMKRAGHCAVCDDCGETTGCS